jgi:hypothetical protein
VLKLQVDRSKVTSTRMALARDRVMSSLSGLDGLEELEFEGHPLPVVTMNSIVQPSTLLKLRGYLVIKINLPTH